ncbi:Brix-domain-containing protein [Gonapodya prolifera JEL478]|uniref:Brix-domain-containing protein n=1 Tax=Gonapodya prolifera (strain JEL478) TaxID=1344416 RepID=A0A139AEQ1_GONPJ|nr:Brix-domain-containing protein [Gonapodya prolifera JEL478]|eukprot:KXS15149.1 Brix-domain-containing protein [Gonapodya prolifera JEL478]
MPDADGLPSMAARGEKMGRKALLLKAGAASGSTKATGALRERRQVDRASGDLGKPQNKQRVLLLSSRGITYRYRHLLNDLHALLPHSKKESKFEQKTELYALNEVAELANCNNAIFLECRRHTDLYLWMAKTPNGPSVKFFVQNVHTMDELRLTGNCLKGSRPIVSFDKNFDSAPHLSLLKEMFTQIFATPRTSRKIKPFVDHVLNFSVVDNKIWFRNYQVVEKAPPIAPGQEPISLVEIGPRFVLDIVRIFDGSFCGATLYENPTFVTPAQVSFPRQTPQPGTDKVDHPYLGATCHECQSRSPLREPEECGRTEI